MSYINFQAIEYFIKNRKHCRGEIALYVKNTLKLEITGQYLWKRVLNPLVELVPKKNNGITNMKSAALLTHMRNFIARK